MAFQIVRIEKVKGSLGGIQSHNFREHESKTNHDIDTTRSSENIFLAEKTNLEKSFSAILEKNGITKFRKDAVKCADIFVGASPEFLNNADEKTQMDYFNNAKKFFEKKLGKENLLYAVIHKDEKTPHLHIGFVPIDKNKKTLSAKNVLNKKFFQSLQDEFNNEVGKNFGLERGEKNSTDEKQKHLSALDYKIKTHKNELAELEKNLNLEKEKMDFFEKEKNNNADDFAKIISANAEFESPIFGNDYYKISPAGMKKIQNYVNDIVQGRAAFEIDNAKNLESENKILKDKLEKTKSDFDDFRKIALDDLENQAGRYERILDRKNKTIAELKTENEARKEMMDEAKVWFSIPNEVTKNELFLSGVKLIAQKTQEKINDDKAIEKIVSTIPKMDKSASIACKPSGVNARKNFAMHAKNLHAAAHSLSSAGRSILSDVLKKSCPESRRAQDLVSGNFYKGDYTDPDAERMRKAAMTYEEKLIENDAKGYF